MYYIGYASTLSKACKKSFTPISDQRFRLWCEAFVHLENLSITKKFFALTINPHDGNVKPKLDKNGFFERNEFDVYFINNKFYAILKAKS